MRTNFVDIMVRCVFYIIVIELVQMHKVNGYCIFAHFVMAKALIFFVFLCKRTMKYLVVVYKKVNSTRMNRMANC